MGRCPAGSGSFPQPDGDGARPASGLARLLPPLLWARCSLPPAHPIPAAILGPRPAPWGRQGDEGTLRPHLVPIKGCSDPQDFPGRRCWGLSWKDCVRGEADPNHSLLSARRPPTDTRGSPPRTRAPGRRPGLGRRCPSQSAACDASRLGRRGHGGLAAAAFSGLSCPLIRLLSGSACRMAPPSFTPISAGQGGGWVPRPQLQRSWGALRKGAAGTGSAQPFSRCQFTTRLFPGSQFDPHYLCGIGANH